MKRLIVLLCALALILSALPAMADMEQGVHPWTLYPIEDGTTFDFDSDGTEETYSFTTDLNEYRDGRFSLSVGEAAVSRDDCILLAEDVYVMYIGWTGYGDWTDDSYYAALFMIPEQGMSDDPYTYCYLYVNGKLFDVGGIPSMPESMTVDRQRGMITTRIRAAMIGTWSRPADYILASGYSWDEEADIYESYYRLTEVPRPIYPFGMIVTLRQELPLMASQTDRIFSATLEADQQVILAASDDVRWLYVTSMDGATAGWVRMSRVDWEQRITVGDRDVAVDDVFGNILYAD